MAGYLFGRTFALLAVIARERPDLAQGVETTEIVRGFLAERLATTHSVRELADEIGAYLRARFKKAFREVTLLAEVARFERLRFDVEVVADGPGEPATSERIQALATLTVGKLFATRVLVPTHVRAFRVRHDVPAALAVLGTKGAGATLAEIVRPAEGVAFLTRDPRLLWPVYQIMPLATWKDLGRFSPGTPFRLEALGVLRAKRGPKGESEEQALGRVATELFGFLATGALLFAGKSARRPVKRSSRRPARRATARSGR
jgi:hypothetical protein